MIAQHKQILLTVEQRQAFFLSLYKKSFPRVARYIEKMGGNLDEAQDIFQDALLIYYEKVVNAATDTINNEQAYLLGIAKKLWLQYYKTCRLQQPLNDFDVESVADQQAATVIIMDYLETAGKKCLNLLKAYYYDHMPADHVAALFGYSGKHSATVAKYKCLEKIRDTVKQKSLKYADFIE